MEQKQKNKQITFIIIGFAILVIGLVGVTYAFFNYTRTGTANNIRTGRIYFNADQGNNTVTLSDLFPISVGENETVTASTPGVGSLKLHITGDTTYTEGIEYLIEAVEVAGNGNTSLPISIDISYVTTEVEQGEDPNVIGTEDEDYFTNRGGNTSRYKLLSTGSISEGEDILVGYIAPGNTGIDGELTILAYLDADNIAITDTYDEDEPETDTNGTTSNWVNGRTVFTTEEWNALQTTGVSFKIRAESNEGIWVEEPSRGIESCQGCKFMYLANTPMYTTWNMAGQYLDDGNIVNIPETPTVLTTGLYDKYEELVTATGKNYFLGVKLNNNNEVTNAYACGVKDNVPFCIEGKLDSGLGGTEAETIYAINQSLLQGTNLYNNTCTVFGATTNGYTLCGPWDNTSSLSVYANSDGTVEAGVGDKGHCDVYSTGSFGCYESDSGSGG